MIAFALSAVLAAACTSAVPAMPAKAADHPEARVFDPTPSLIAQEAVDETLADAALAGKHAIIVMGADWCHDSRALAGCFQTPRFETLLQENFVVRYIDVGQKDRNIDVAQRFGLDGSAALGGFSGCSIYRYYFRGPCDFRCRGRNTHD